MPFNNFVIFQFSAIFVHGLKIKIVYYFTNFFTTEINKLTVWKSANDRFLLAWATNFMASMSDPLYFRASLPLTIFWTSSGL